MPLQSNTSGSLIPHLRQSPLSRLRLLLITSGMLGIQLCYSIQINLGTAHLISLGLPHRLVSLAWLAGPLSGLIVQPIIGIASDHCTSSYGRRRPFLFAGAILSAFALILFSFAQPISNLFHLSTNSCLVIAITAFFLLDFSIQAIQAPLRALLTDVLLPKQLATGNACIGFFTGLGNLIGGSLASIPPLKSIPLQHIQIVSISSAILLLLSVFTTIFSVIENGSRSRTNSNHHQKNDSFSINPFNKSFFKTIYALPFPFWRVFCIQLCTWCGFFALFVYVNTWVATNVFGGIHHATDPILSYKYAKGIQLGARANALTALCTILYSLLLPKLTYQFGVTAMYAFSQLIETICLVAAPFIRLSSQEKYPSKQLQSLVVLDIASFGVVWATTMGIPWTLIGNALEADPRFAPHVGLLTTVFNASQSLPQLIVAFVAPLILAIRDDSAYVMFCGGICAAIGMMLVIILKVDKVERKDKVKEGLLKNLVVERTPNKD